MSDFYKDTKDHSKDVIYRQDAIDAVNMGALSAATIYGRTDEGSTALYETVKAIMALPSAQPEPQWIPCSERLPESKVDVLVWKDNMYSVAWYQELTKHWLSNDFSANESKNVIAWQPLPSPYKPEEKQEEPQTNFYAERFNR